MRPDSLGKSWIRGCAMWITSYEEEGAGVKRQIPELRFHAIKQIYMTLEITKILL